MKNLQLTSHLMVNVFHQRSGIKEESALITSIQHCNGGLSQCNKARKRNKRHRDLKRRNKTLFENNISMYIECSKEFPKKKKELELSEFSKIA